MPIARTTHQLTVLNDFIYAYGGFDDAGNGVLSIDRYDIKNDQWSSMSSVPGTISKTWPQSIGILNERFYMSVFHTPSTFKIVQKGYFYDIVQDEWIDAPVINEKARYCHTSTLIFPRKIFNANEKCISIKDFSNIKRTIKHSNKNIPVDDSLCED